MRPYSRFFCTQKMNYSENPYKPIINWLLLGCFLIFLMVFIGGLTRLTHSGLSMVEWNMFMGSIPPLNEADWQETFDKYKQYPEYQKVNFHFSLNEFKKIFLWEYSHRFLGRLIGLVFIVPFLWFLFKGKLWPALTWKLLIILFLGGFQGFLGWYMVKSGMVNIPDVSHYRLAAHLITAFITFAYTFWVVLDLLYPKNKNRQMKIAPWIWTLLILLIIQIVYGAFVAGLNAGKIFTTWPLMGDSWIASAVTSMQPLWKNFTEGIGGVQFVHRYLAYIVVGMVLMVYFKSRDLFLKSNQKKGLNFMLLMVGLQFLLGVFTLVFSVPLVMGVLHQFGAFLLLAAVVFCLHSFTSNPSVPSIST